MKKLLLLTLLTLPQCSNAFEIRPSVGVTYNRLDLNPSNVGPLGNMSLQSYTFDFRIPLCHCLELSMGAGQSFLSIASNGAVGPQGATGPQGVPGQNGQNGKDGEDDKDGKKSKGASGALPGSNGNQSFQGYNFNISLRYYF